MSFITSTPFPELATSRLLLQRPSLKDTSDYHKILSCPEVSRYSDIPHNPNKKSSERFVSRISKLHARGTGIGWIIKLRGLNNTIGSVRINSIEKKASCGVIGYEVHPDFWNTGYATEALGAVVDHAHSTMGLNRLEAWTTVGNDASEKVLLHCGFQYEGTQRSKVRFRDQYWDIRLYARLSADDRRYQDND